MRSAFWDGYCEEGGHFGRVEVVEGGVDVPAVEARVGQVVGFGDGVLVKGLVVGVLEGEVFQAFVLVEVTVADDLDFGLVRHGFEIRVQYAALCVQCLAMAIAFGGGVEAVGEFVLRFWGALGLVLEDHYMILVESISDEVEVIICMIRSGLFHELFPCPIYLRRRLPIHGVLPISLPPSRHADYWCLLTCEILDMDIVHRCAEINIR